MSTSSRPPAYVPTEPFCPVPGLDSPHAQTVLGLLLRAAPGPWLARERWETPDGDFVDVDWLEADPAAPHLLVLHGLEGSARSGYVSVTLQHARARGWGALALNFRSCGGEPNRLLRSYHSGDTRDAAFALERLRERTSGPLLAVGFSLGGNVLVKLLAEAGERCLLHAAAAVSVPYDLARCAESLDVTGGWNQLYRRWFLLTLKAKARQKARDFPGRLDVERILAARGIRDFDDAVTAPINGFEGVADYYRRASSGPMVGHVRRPTLFLTAADDPLVPGGCIPEDATRNPFLSLLVTDKGGHVGFVGGSLWRPRFWAEQEAIEFLARQL